MFHSDKPHSFKPRSTRYVEAPTLVPPKLSELGHLPFSSVEWQSLARWLQEPTWPRGTLNIYALEGYLTALLAWPVALQPGAWLPPIWNEKGWRVRPPIDTVRRYGEFLELVVGFLRSIDRGLLQTPPLFEPSLRLSFSHDDLDMKGRAQHWAQGFGRAFEQSAQARVAPTPEAREAVRTIAAYAVDQPHIDEGTHRADISLTHAVLVLAATRVSRGPLGALPKHDVTATPTDPQIRSHEGAGALKDGSPH